MKKKILITGGSGFLGWHIARRLRDDYEVWAAYGAHPFELEGVKTIPLDVTNGDEVEQKLVSIAPHAVVHAAADTDVDRCEVEREAAYRVNVSGTENVLEAASTLGSPVVYTSTDLVFAEGKRMYAEEDAPSPMNYYGWTKLEGEKRAAECDWAVTLRMALIYGADTRMRGSFLRWMRESLESGKEVRLYTDQYRTPLYVEDAVEAVDAVLRGGAKRRLYNIGGPERIDRFSFGRIYAEVFGYDPALLVASRMEGVPSRARRPRDCSMSIGRARRDLSFSPLSVRDGLVALKESTLSSSD